MSRAIATMTALLLSAMMRNAVLSQVSNDSIIVIAVSNWSITFKCVTNTSNPTVWQFKQPSADMFSVLYYGVTRAKNVDSRLTVAVNTALHRSDLTIDRVQPGDAGKYACFGQKNLMWKLYFELTVLEGDPLCQSNMTSAAAVFDAIAVTCSVNITGGYYLPMFRCQTPLPVLSNITDVHLPTIKHTLVVLLDLTYDLSVTCQTSATDVVGMSSLHYASYVTPIYSFTWTSPKVTFKGDETTHAAVLTHEYPIVARADGVSNGMFVKTLSILSAVFLSVVICVVVVFVVVLRRRQSTTDNRTHNDIAGVADETADSRFNSTRRRPDNVTDDGVVPARSQDSVLRHQAANNENGHYLEIGDSARQPDVVADNASSYVLSDCYEGLEPKNVRQGILPHSPTVYSGLVVADGNRDIKDDQLSIRKRGRSLPLLVT